MEITVGTVKAVGNLEHGFDVYSFNPDDRNIQEHCICKIKLGVFGNDSLTMTGFSSTMHYGETVLKLLSILLTKVRQYKETGKLQSYEYALAE